MSTSTVLATDVTRGPRARRPARSMARGVGLFGLAVAGLALVAGVVAAAVYAEVSWFDYARDNSLARAAAVLAALAVVAAFSLPKSQLAVRHLANLTRRLSSRWCAVAIPEPYPQWTTADGKPGSWRWSLRVLGQPATWRDLAWMLVAPCASAFLLLPLATTVSFVWYITAGHQHKPSVLLGISAVTVATIWSSPWLLQGYGLLARLLLGPTAQAELSERVRHLAETRSESLDASASELRRIERDLHDGAQARLVALGMTLGALEEVIGKDNHAARGLLVEARGSSSRALAELRDLVRGIHPPVLADRGLADAVRALALDNPLPVYVTSGLAGRPPAPVESAIYFGVSELLANVSKHSAATQAWVELRHGDDVLVARVVDDGGGGADPRRGTGLHGIERRLAAFDGHLDVDSPPGGPTFVTLEVPCELSSPRTSSY